MRATWLTRLAGTPTIKYGTSTGNYTSTVTGETSTYTAADLCGTPAQDLGWKKLGGCPRGGGGADHEVVPLLWLHALAALGSTGCVPALLGACVCPCPPSPGDPCPWRPCRLGCGLCPWGGAARGGGAPPLGVLAPAPGVVLAEQGGASPAGTSPGTAADGWLACPAGVVGTAPHGRSALLAAAAAAAVAAALLAVLQATSTLPS